MSPEKGVFSWHVMLVLCAIVLFCGALAVFAVSCDLGQSEFKNVRAAELKRMMDGGTRLLVVDTRIEREYREGHVPGAILIPPHKFMKIEQYLPREKDTTLVFYCRGAG